MVEEFDSLPVQSASVSAKPIDFAAEKAARAARSAENAADFAKSRLADSEPVFIKRANGEISV